MRRAFLLLCLMNIFIFNSFAQSAPAAKENNNEKTAFQQQQEEEPHHENAASGDHAGGDEHQVDHGDSSGHEGPAGWSVIPFILLLLMIATGPLFYEHFWHKNYPVIAIFLALIVVFYYLFVLHNTHNPIHHLAEYIQFISLVGSLFVASGGILLKVNKKGTPFTNVILLAAGSVLANLVSTIGASMLLIRPFIRLNRNRIKPYHIVFFIFTVSNIGGCLTPIGDPPLFLGFLKGVPFFWTLTHNIVPWALAIAAICGIFYIVDSRNKSDYEPEPTTEPAREEAVEGNPGFEIQGKKNFIWLLIIVLAVFIDPNVFNWVPGIPYHGANFSFIREIIMITVAFLSYFMADKEALRGNEFNFEPIREVGFLFIGIFGTMMPALELVGNFAQSEEGMAFISRNTLFWGTGILSGFLDNAPTYLNFLAAGMAAKGGEINQVADVIKFAQGGFPGSVILLKAVSIAAVFFGAMTYIGNAPNFMVKSIAEQVGIKMPSFFGYMIRFSIPILIPLFIIFWLVFFYYA